jgi:phage gpG-like protein
MERESLVRISIDSFGESQLSREILRVSEHAENMVPAFNAVRDLFYKLEKEQFESGGKYSPGGAWAPLAQGTIDAKVRAGLPPDILVATGRLKASLTTSGDADAKYETTADSMTIGSNVPYGMFHQSTQPRTRLPRRPPVSIPEQNKKEWLKVLQRYLITGEVA